ncbi:MAG: ADP-ribosylation factor-like protein [Candidatus Thorarchaeota archaeon]
MNSDTKDYFSSFIEYEELEKIRLKVVFIGLTQAGKTSIVQVAMEDYLPQETMSNPATVDISRKIIKKEKTPILVFDVGGQFQYIERIFKDWRDKTFSDVNIAVFVIDAMDYEKYSNAKHYFDLTAKNLYQYSSDALFYLYIHKMDLIPKDERENKVNEIKEFFELFKYSKIKIFQTSIYEDSIYKAIEELLLKVYPGK